MAAWIAGYRPKIRPMPVAAITDTKTIGTDITSGMTTGHRILTLRDADANLKQFAIPATADATGSDTYGKDGYWFDTTAERAALRGGAFNNGADAGVFALSLSTGPHNTSCNTGWRACKCL